MSEKKLKLGDDITLYSLPETAAILKITKQSMYNMIRAGKIEASKVGREYRISEKAIKEYLTANKNK